jgi:methionyl-tRNA formyltransferase
MNRDKNIVFMGTPQFAVESLKNIHESGYHIVAVICPPDKPAGRGHKLQACDVKKYAVSQNLNVLQPKKLKSPEFLSELKSLNADLFVVVAFRMLPKEVWSMPQYGTFNIHGSLLPQYRGAAPINWAVMNGETKTGVTSFFIDENIDTGATLRSKECEIDSNETVGDVHDRLMHLGAELATETCDAIFDDRIQAKIQEESTHLKKAPKLFKNDCKIDWSKSTIEIHNHIRGLSPYPAAWTTFIRSENEPQTIKIYKASYTLTDHDREIAEIQADKKDLKIYTKDGFISMLKIQVPGKKKMDIQSFLNGINIKSYKKAC